MLRAGWLLLPALAASLGQAATAASGFATRDLNPLLQPIYLPTFLPLRGDDGWQLDQTLHITNTAQVDQSSDELLVIDVENYRYELALGWRRQNWIFHASLPLIANRGGRLDGFIEDWHDFFGFPNGDRDKFTDDQVQIEYTRDGVLEFSQTDSSSGVGDLAMVFGYQPADRFGFYVGIELPTGDEDELSGNEALDLALWLAHHKTVGEKSTAYGMFGVSLPGDYDALDGYVTDAIWVAQLGFDYRFDHGIVGTAQLDFHSETVDGSSLDAFDESLQLQLGLGFTQLVENHRLDLFIAEDILVGSAPDFTLSLRLRRNF